MKIENKLKGKTAYDCMVYGSFIDIDEKIDERLNKAVPNVDKMVEIIGELTDDSISTIISFMLQYHGARYVYDLVNRYISELNATKEAESIEAEVVDIDDYKEITSKAVGKSETNLIVADATASSHLETDELFGVLLAEVPSESKERIEQLDSYKIMYELVNTLVDFIKINNVNNPTEVKDSDKISGLVEDLCKVAGFTSKNKMRKALKLGKKASLEKIFITLFKNIIINDSKLNKLLDSEVIETIISEIKGIFIHDNDHVKDSDTITDKDLENKVNLIRSRVKTANKDRSNKYVDAMYYIINSGIVESFISQNFGILLKDVVTPQYIELDVPEDRAQHGFDICLHTNINPNTDVRIIANSNMPLQYNNGNTGYLCVYEIVPKYKENQKAS